MEEVPLAYLPGGLTRVRVKAIGSLKGFSSDMLHALHAHTQGRASLQASSKRYQTLNVSTRTL